MAATLRHAEVVEELIALQTAMSSTVERVLECSPGRASWVEVIGKLAAMFWGLEETCSRLEEPGGKICSLLLGPSSGQARWADRLGEAVGRLEVVLAEHCQMDTELEALRTSVVFVWDLILGDGSGSSSLAASLSMVAEEVEKWVNAVAANGVWWGTRFGRCPIAFSRTGIQAGAAWVQAGCRLERRLGRCPLAFAEHGLGPTGVTRPFLACSRSFGRHGVVAASDQLFFCFVTYDIPG
jgi:hypothetical protein